MNKEKLIEKMREVSDAYVRDLIDEVPEAAHYLLMNDIAENMSISCAEAALTLMDNEWVRVEDRLPENTGSYLCITNDRKWVVAAVATNGWWTMSPDGKYYGDMGNKVTVNGKLIDREVTHWCNLPSPPKDK